MIDGATFGGMLLDWLAVVVVIVGLYALYRQIQLRRSELEWWHEYEQLEARRAHVEILRDEDLPLDWEKLGW